MDDAGGIPEAFIGEWTSEGIYFGDGISDDLIERFYKIQLRIEPEGVYLMTYEGIIDFRDFTVDGASLLMNHEGIEYRFTMAEDGHMISAISAEDGEVGHDLYR